MRSSGGRLVVLGAVNQLLRRTIPPSFATLYFICASRMRARSNAGDM
jgi:hypothetical protein